MESFEERKIRRLSKIRICKFCEKEIDNLDIVDMSEKDIDNFVNSIDRAWKILDFDRVEDQYFPVNILKT